LRSQETTFGWNVDTTAPAVIFTGGVPSDPTTSRYPSIAFDSQDGKSGIAWFKCKFDSESKYEECASPRNFADLQLGPHIFSVISSDNAGNISEPATIQWAIVVPTVRIVDRPALSSNSVNARFRFEGSSPAGGDSFNCSIDGKPEESCMSPKSYENLSDGSHTFAVTFTDTNNKKSLPATFTWQITTQKFDESFILTRWRAGIRNGWFPRLSNDGRYVAFGFGGMAVADLTTGQETVLHPNNAFSANWIRPGVLTYIREADARGNIAERYEVNAGEWIPRRQDEDPSIVSGNIFAAADGHWASYLGLGGRISFDGRVLMTGAQGALATSRGWVVHVTGDEKFINVWIDGVLSRAHPALTPVHQMTINSGYIAYGGYGPVRAITPQGQDINVSIAPWGWEGTGQFFFVNGQPWIATATWANHLQKGYILLRPFGETRPIIIEGDVAGMHVTAIGDIIHLAFNDPLGVLQVLTFKASAPRQWFDPVR
jgi:hypothetical protein